MKELNGFFRQKGSKTRVLYSTERKMEKVSRRIFTSIFMPPYFIHFHEKKKGFKCVLLLQLAIILEYTWPTQTRFGVFLNRQASVAFSRLCGKFSGERGVDGDTVEAHLPLRR